MKPMSLAQRPRWEVEEGPCRRLHHIVCINCEPEVVEVRAVFRAGFGADEVHCVRCLRAKALEERRLMQHDAEEDEGSAVRECDLSSREQQQQRGPPLHVARRPDA